MKNNEIEKLFVTCSPGLETLLEQELQELGYAQLSSGYCGVYVPATTIEEIYKINYCSRIASRVLLPLKKFSCKDQQDLYQSISQYPWIDLIQPSQTIAIDSNVTHKRLRNSLFAAQVTKDAICDQFMKKFGSRPSVQLRNPDIQLNLFIHHTDAVISFDTSGEPLYKRGYRQESVEAPLKETLAAAMLKLGKYSDESILFDPCCGSGTFLVEAALLASNTPSGSFRKKWGFMALPEFNSEAWKNFTNKFEEHKIPLKKEKIWGIDLNKNTVRIAKNCIKIAGFSQQINVEVADFREYDPPIEPNYLITNPPHGKRLGEVEYLKPLYRALGNFMKKKMAKPSHGFVFTGDLELAKEIGLAASKRHVIDNSGVDSRLLEFEIY